MFESELIAVVYLQILKLDRKRNAYSYAISKKATANLAQIQPSAEKGSIYDQGLKERVISCCCSNYPNYAP